MVDGYVHHVGCEAEKASLQSGEMQGRLSWVYFWILDAFLPSGQGDIVYLYNKFPSCVLLLLKWLCIPSKQDWNNTEMGFSCLQNPFTFTYEKES